MVVGFLGVQKDVSELVSFYLRRVRPAEMRTAARQVAEITRMRYQGLVPYEQPELGLA